MIEYLANIDAPVLAVRHAELTRYPHSDSEFRSLCPVCEYGILLVHRDQKTLALARWDRCTRCAQAFRYLDEDIAGERFSEPLESITS